MRTVYLDKLKIQFSPAALVPVGRLQVSININVTPQRPTSFVPGHAGKLMLETDLCDSDAFYYPATPPLSTSGSSMGITELNPQHEELNRRPCFKTRATCANFVVSTKT
ncbi:hypothetical protein F4777DRAFT_252087 [Nemania sp. FL0916]|nr:hypothetical protein F4777DRAFT_252087 [Nemania sp. FL0916]